MSKVKIKRGFLGFRFIVNRGGNAEKLILKINSFFDALKTFFFKILKSNTITQRFIKNLKITKTMILDEGTFIFRDFFLSGSLGALEIDIIGRDEYNLKNIDFKAGDIVIDIGANIGMVSILLAKKYPFLKIYAFEPAKENYLNFLDNIKLNNIHNDTITVENKAVNSDGRDVSFGFNIVLSGGSKILDAEIQNKNDKKSHMIEQKVKSTTLDEIFHKYNINEVKLLKIDCEGSEYEILYNASPDILRKIRHLRGEFHKVEKETEGYNPKDLSDFCKKYISDTEFST
jgi:FkbM family methyltransferase